MIPVLLSLALAAPVPAPHPTPPPTDWSWVRPACATLLWQWEAEALDYPPLAHLERFPPAAVAKAYTDFAAEHCAWLQAEATLDPAAHDAIYVWLMEANCRQQAWSALASAHTSSQMGPCGIWGAASRAYWTRHDLAHLRDVLGPEAYEEARMPPPAPLHWFRRMP